MRCTTRSSSTAHRFSSAAIPRAMDPMTITSLPRRSMYVASLGFSVWGQYLIAFAVAITFGSFLLMLGWNLQEKFEILRSKGCKLIGTFVYIILLCLFNDKFFNDFWNLAKWKTVILRLGDKYRDMASP